MSDYYYDEDDYYGYGSEEDNDYEDSTGGFSCNSGTNNSSGYNYSSSHRAEVEYDEICSEKMLDVSSAANFIFWWD